MKLELPKRTATREALLKGEIFKEHHVWGDDITLEDVENFEYMLDNAKSEHSIQKYLEKNPIILIQHLGGGHGRWVIPQKRLGAEFIPDFIIGERHSFGYEWIAVELKDPNYKMFTKRKKQTSQLTEAINQIQDCRAWLQRNQNYAARPKNENGLGLIDIVAKLPGLILIGRRTDVDPVTNDKRRQIGHDLDIQIHTYDFLIDNGLGRAKSLAK